MHHSTTEPRTVVVYAGNDYTAARLTLDSIDQATAGGSGHDVQVLVVVDDLAPATSLTGQFPGLAVELVPAEGLSKWAAIARAQRRSTSSSPDILYAGESYAPVDRGLALQAASRDAAAPTAPAAPSAGRSLADLNITFNQTVDVHRDTVFEGSSKWYASIDNRRPAHFGAFSYSYSPIPRTVTHIGRYCSIAGEVLFGAAGHPTGFLSTSPFIYEPDHPPFDALWERAGRPAPVVHEYSEQQQYPDITIGNDVWVGARAAIRGGVHLGDGCIVGTSAVVTRDVPPYAIVGGSPARTLRMRFGASLVERLQQSAWWRFDPLTLSRFPLGDPELALDLLEAAERSGEIVEWSPEREPLSRLLAPEGP